MSAGPSPHEANDAFPGDDFPDEPWEADIVDLLSGLGPVDPPSGFIEEAIDHRPLFAGRAMLGSMAAATVVFAASFAVGAFGQPRLVPELNTLTSGAAVAHSDPSASVFREPGSIELDALPGGERIDVAGRDAWMDPDNDVVVVATESAFGTMVGVTPEEAEALIDDVDGGPEGVAGIINRLTAAVGFPDLS